jgi:hypothetical protein
MKKLVATGLAALALTAAVVQSAPADSNVPPTPPADVSSALGQPTSRSWSPHGASYTQGTLYCLQGVPTTFYTRMIETTPSVRAADTTPAVDRQQIWLQELDYKYQTGFPQGQWVLDGQPVWVYANATDGAWTNRWYTQDGKLAAAKVSGIANTLFFVDLLGTPPTWSETMWNVLYVPGTNGTWQTTGFGTLPSKTTGLTFGIPSC